MVQENCLKPKIIIITGPTAVGKSDLAIKIAKQLDIKVFNMHMAKGVYFTLPDRKVLLFS